MVGRWLVAVRVIWKYFARPVAPFHTHFFNMALGVWLGICNLANLLGSGP
ncbi:hypothetical protein TSACC_2143 [Terrimicrobium sacchariphilum]|uniref:Uncharacterized protein n=1 Tax=Terrimicrobium sacchariphilum TaxID=690879 RepID=A0A146G1L0_TERSA|nr:hypothetical protein TSACC_2143 [Terrimicrobium sacchariphilum]